MKINHAHFFFKSVSYFFSSFFAPSNQNKNYFSQNVSNKNRGEKIKTGRPSNEEGFFLILRREEATVSVVCSTRTHTRTCTHTQTTTDKHCSTKSNLPSLQNREENDLKLKGFKISEMCRFFFSPQLEVRGSPLPQQ